MPIVKTESKKQETREHIENAISIIKMCRIDITNVDVVRLLLQNGAKVNDKDNDGKTALMFAVKSTVMDNSTLEMTRRLFLFTYYCYGISFMDAALLSKKNIIRYNGGDYIVYKRHKTKEAKKVKPIQIKITDTIQELFDWFKVNTILIEDYLLPIVSREAYKGQQLYDHIRSRFSRNNKNLKNLATALDITDMKLTSYTFRQRILSFDLKTSRLQKIFS